MNNKIISIGFAVLLFALSLVNLFHPTREFSENENRSLQQVPVLSAETLLSGKFTADFASYASDQFWGRDNWISLKTLTELALLKKDNGRVYFGKENTLFDASETMDMARLDTNARAVAQFAEKLRQEVPALRASTLLIPSASAVYTDRLPAYAPVPDQQAALEQTAKLLEDSAPLFDVLPLLNNRKATSLYYRTDHHWTTDAAYLVYQRWAQENELSPLSLDDMNTTTISRSFHGTLHSKANLLTIPPDVMKAYIPRDSRVVSVDYGEGETSDSLFFEEFLDKKDKYAYFLGTNRPLIEIETSVKNGRSLLLIKDSYAHCFVPFLTAHYQHILVADPRYLNVDYVDYAKQKDVTDLLTLYSLPVFAFDRNVVRLIL